MVIQNSIAFLVAWEIMMLSAFLAVTFEHEKNSTSQSGHKLFNAITYFRGIFGTLDLYG